MVFWITYHVQLVLRTRAFTERQKSPNITPSEVIRRPATPMLQTPREIAARFDRALESAAIAEYVRPHYRRWLRFYLGFCAKYEWDPGSPAAVKPFCDKLESKGQEDWKRRQASAAIALYQEAVLRAAEHPLSVGDGEDRSLPSQPSRLPAPSAPIAREQRKHDRELASDGRASTRRTPTPVYEPPSTPMKAIQSSSPNMASRTSAPRPVARAAAHPFATMVNEPSERPAHRPSAAPPPQRSRPGPSFGSKRRDPEQSISSANDD